MDSRKNWFRRKTEALYLRLVPSARPWARIGDFVTFTSRGFVAARSPEELLGRHNHEVAYIRSTLADNSFAASLEIGCGFGRLTPWLSGNSKWHVAIDINADALGQARRYYPNCDFRLGSVTDLPFNDESFDFIAAWTVLQHLPPHLIDRALSEVSRVAGPECMLLLCEETAQAATQVVDRWHTHTWHRDCEYYAERLPSFTIEKAGSIEALAVLGIEPGTIMTFRRRPA